MILTGRSGNAGYANNKYKFTGKERDVETGYDYFGARYYDSRIGRWLVVDPLLEKYPGWNPYTYSLNNPVTYFDPDGRFVWGPGAVAVAAGALEILGWATIATGVVISAVGPENTGRGVMETGEWLQKQSSNLVNLIPDLTTTPTPFPITQGEGINQTILMPTDASGVKIDQTQVLIDQNVPGIQNLYSKGLEKQLKAHENKLKEYKKNPEAFDNKGHLKNAKTQEQRNSIINSRIKKLEKQIDNFKKQIEKNK